jgi:phage FluMu gp28-like protein
VTAAAGDNFAQRWVAETQGAVPLYAYQQRWLADDSPLKAGKWCRSAGKTFVIMLEPVLDCELATTEGRRVNWFCFSGSEGQTKEMVRQAAIHARAIELAVNEFDEEEILVTKSGEQIRVTNHVVEFEGGSRIVGLPTNPLSIRGRHGNIIWDEAGTTPNAEEIWSAAAPIAGRKGFKLRVVGTPGPKSGPFWEIFSGILPGADYAGATRTDGWSRHNVDVYLAIAEGAPLDLAKIKTVVRGRRFITEYEVMFEDAESRLISLERIVACEDPSTLTAQFLRIDAEHRGDWEPFLDKSSGEAPPSDGYDEQIAWARLFAPLAGKNLFLGYDVARKRHLSVLWIVEPDGGLRRTRAVVAFYRRRFAEQRAALWAAAMHCRRICIDSTGLGTQLAEETVEYFGESRVEAVDFNLAVKEDLATRMLRGYEDVSQRIPPSPEIRDSINSVYKINTAAGHARYDADATEESGHADYFWAQALSLLAAGDANAVPMMKSYGRRTWSRAGGMF